MRTVLIVGASLAGLSAARALRVRGFEGRVTLVGAEPHPPYDRPPLSKDFLTGAATAADLALGIEEDAALDLQWRLGVPAVALDGRTRTLRLADGDGLTADGIVIATGATPRRLPGSEGLEGVHHLRSLDDALALRRALRAGGRLVVIGAGFVGAEVASSARTLGVGVGVTVLEAGDTPLAPLGREMGELCAGLHRDAGVELRTGAAVRRLVAASGRVAAVELVDGSQLPADHVLVGIGVRPAVDWLAGSGVELRDGVLTDAGGATNVPGIVAAGDCTRSYDPATGTHNRYEHWTNALQQPTAAVATLLGEEPPAPGVPYFWSEQYGVRIQFAGHRRDGDAVRVVDGDPATRSFLALYERHGVPVAVLGMDSPRLFTRWRRQLAAAPAAA